MRADLIFKTFTRRKTRRADAATQIFPRADVSDSFLPCFCIKFWTPVLLMTMMALNAESILAGVACPELVYIDVRRPSWKLASNLDSLSFARKTRRRLSGPWQKSLTIFTLTAKVADRNARASMVYSYTLTVECGWLYSL